MKAGRLLRLALLLVITALLLPAMNEAVVLADRDQLDSWQGLALKGAVGAFCLALLLSLVEKLGGRVAGARCRDCRRRVPHGHAYCLDHLQARRQQAQERLHRERGSGV